MTISPKRRREIAQEMRDFHEAWELASLHAEAGDSKMAARILDTVKVSKPKSPEEGAWLLRQAFKAKARIEAEEYERRLQGLPRPEPKKLAIH